MEDERAIYREDVNAILEVLFDIRLYLVQLVVNTGGFGEEEADDEP